MPRKYMEMCSTSLTIREMEIKSTVIYHLTPVRMSIIKKTEISYLSPDNCWLGDITGSSKRIAQLGPITLENHGDSKIGVLSYCVLG